MHLLILSPHRDDAALSLGLTIRGWLAAGHTVTVLGVFTRSLSAPYSDADTVHPNDRLSYVSAMRRREDAEFLKLMPGLEMIDLNLKDAVLRVRCPAEDVYTQAPTVDDTAIAKIHKAIAKMQVQQTIDAVVLPMGLGHHVDHLVVRDAAISAVAGKPSALYEDLPDILRGSMEADEQIEAELDSVRVAGYVASLEAVMPTGTGSEAAVKRRILAVYGSQIDDATIDAILQYSTQIGGERLWANPAWRTLWA